MSIRLRISLFEKFMIYIGKYEYDMMNFMKYVGNGRPTSMRLVSRTLVQDVCAGRSGRCPCSDS